jgi:hypothetical protein
MSALVKIMNDEIKKYQGRIYYLDIQKDIYGNYLKPQIEKATWIYDTSCYNHYSFELHHIIKFTPYERNKEWFKEHGLENCLILIPKVLHQHLENPEYKLSNEQFYNKYLINRYELLFIKSEYDKGNYPEILSNPTQNEIEYDGCFDSICRSEKTTAKTQGVYL